MFIVIGNGHGDPNSNPVVIYEGLYFDLAQGQMNGAPNETSSNPVLDCLHFK